MLLSAGVHQLRCRADNCGGIMGRTGCISSTNQCALFPLGPHSFSPQPLFTAQSQCLQPLPPAPAPVESAAAAACGDRKAAGVWTVTWCESLLHPTSWSSILCPQAHCVLSLETGAPMCPVPLRPACSLLRPRGRWMCIPSECMQHRGKMPAHSFVKGPEIISLSSQLPWLHLCPRINPP